MQLKISRFKPIVSVLPLVLLVVTVTAIVLWPRSKGEQTASGDWTCSMHPQVLLAVPIGIAANFVMHFAIMWGLVTSSHTGGWPIAIAIAVGIMVAAAVYRMGREQMLPLYQNLVSRAILGVSRPARRWVLDHKFSFLMLPLAIILLGMLICQGAGPVASPLGAVTKPFGMDITTTAAWSRVHDSFPGIGREFMPPLDEGSLLFMPSLLPSASLSEAQEVMAKQNSAMAKVPEVESVVGKMGRAESALDPAPIGMFETIIILQAGTPVADGAR